MSYPPVIPSTNTRSSLLANLRGYTGPQQAQQAQLPHQNQNQTSFQHQSQQSYNQNNGYPQRTPSAGPNHPQNQQQSNNGYSHQQNQQNNYSSQQQQYGSGQGQQQQLNRLPNHTPQHRQRFPSSDHTLGPSFDDDDEDEEMVQKMAALNAGMLYGGRGGDQRGGGGNGLGREMGGGARIGNGGQGGRGGMGQQQQQQQVGQQDLLAIVQQIAKNGPRNLEEAQLLQAVVSQQANQQRETEAQLTRILRMQEAQRLQQQLIAQAQQAAALAARPQTASPLSSNRLPNPNYHHGSQLPRPDSANSAAFANNSNDPRYNQRAFDSSYAQAQAQVQQQHHQAQRQQQQTPQQLASAYEQRQSAQLQIQANLRARVGADGMGGGQGGAGGRGQQLPTPAAVAASGSSFGFQQSRENALREQQQRELQIQQLQLQQQQQRLAMHNQQLAASQGGIGRVLSPGPGGAGGMDGLLSELGRVGSPLSAQQQQQLQHQQLLQQNNILLAQYERQMRELGGGDSQQHGRGQGERDDSARQQSQLGGRDDFDYQQAHDRVLSPPLPPLTPSSTNAPTTTNNSSTLTLTGLAPSNAANAASAVSANWRTKPASPLPPSSEPIPAPATNHPSSPTASSTASSGDVKPVYEGIGLGSPVPSSTANANGNASSVTATTAGSRSTSLSAAAAALNNRNSGMGSLGLGRAPSPNPPAPASVASSRNPSGNERDARSRNVSEAVVARPARTYELASGGVMASTSGVIRQPRGPPGTPDELGSRNFASRIRKQAGSKLSVLGRRGDVAA